MQNFIDTVTQQPWAFDSDVVVTSTGGVYSFRSAEGIALPVPSTLQPYTPAAPTAAELLAVARTVQNAAIDAAYAAAVTSSVSFKTAAGVTQTFQADTASQTMLMQAAQGYMMAGAMPAGFYWKSADNTQVAFTLADLQGLYSTILAQGWAAFQKRTTLKQQIAAATTVSAVQVIIWGQ